MKIVPPNRNELGYRIDTENAPWVNTSELEHLNEKTEQLDHVRQFY
jgi:hypothetical protein